MADQGKCAMNRPRDVAIDILWKWRGGTYADIVELVNPSNTTPLSRTMRALLTAIEKGIEEDRRRPTW